MKRLLVLAIMLPGCQQIGGGGITGPVSLKEGGNALRYGVEFLLRAQNKDGSWGEPRRSSGFEEWLPSGDDMHHTLRVATTALCVLALRLTAFTDETTVKAHRRGVEYLVAHGHVRRQDVTSLYNVWAHIFALQALGHEHSVTHEERLLQAARKHVAALAAYETVYGGWTYQDAYGTVRPGAPPMSCLTAVAVIAFERVRPAVPEAMVQRGLEVLLQCRNPDGGYLHRLDDRVRGSEIVSCGAGGLARRQAANYALLKNLRLSEYECRAGLDELFAQGPLLRQARKRPLPHDSFYAVSGAYYYFAYYHAARIISQLPPEDRRIYVPKLLSAVVPFQERDGSWWDQPLYGYHKPYATALAVMALALCQ